MRIGITYDLKQAKAAEPGCPDDFQEEFDSPATIDAIATVLEGRGHSVMRLGDGKPLLRRLLDDPPDFVFNIAEGEGVGRSREARVPAVLEMLGIPYSGSDPLTLAATLDKDCAKRIVSTAGVTVPRGVLIEPQTGGPWQAAVAALTLPVIVKPAWEGSSKGVRNKCLIDRGDPLDALIPEMLRDYRQPILVEEYVRGEELTVGVLGNAPARVLGITHVIPLQNADRFIYSLEVKRDWEDKIRYDYAPRFPEAVQAAIEKAALDSYGVLGCRDVARVDFRLRDGVPVFLEVNPLPGLRPEYSDLALQANARGMSYEALVTAIFDAALARCGMKR